MPVTLCFIKDKHKVMEHKIPLETYFAGLLQKVEWQIQEYEDTAADTLTLCRLCVDYLQEILGELKNFIISYPFASTEEEIPHFFKGTETAFSEQNHLLQHRLQDRGALPQRQRGSAKDSPCCRKPTGFQSRSSGTWRSTSTTERKPPTWTGSISCVGSLTYKSSWTVSITKQTHSSAPVTISR